MGLNIVFLHAPPPKYEFPRFSYLRLRVIEMNALRSTDLAHEIFESLAVELLRLKWIRTHIIAEFRPK